MSKCISRHGEYSEHTYPQHAAGADRFVCELCAALDEDDMLAALDQAEAERDKAQARLRRVLNTADTLTWRNGYGDAQQLIYAAIHGEDQS